MAKSTRAVVLSGQDKYVPLIGAELFAYEVRFYVTNLTTQASQSVNREWYPERKFTGRVAFAQEEYVIKESLINFNHQMLARFESPTLKLLTELQCMQIEDNHLFLDALISSRFVTDTLLPAGEASTPIAAAVYLALRSNVQALLQGEKKTLTSQIAQPDHAAYSVRKTPRMPIDGFYYSMANFASATLYIQSWAFDEACVFPNTAIQATQDNQGRPPASAGGADVPGGPTNRPPSEGDGAPPETGKPRPPSAEDPTPGLPPQKPGQSPEETTRPGAVYEIEYGYTIAGRAQVNRSTVTGTITGYRIRNVGSVGGKEADFAFGVGTSTPSTAGKVSWNVNGFPNQIPSGFFIRVIRRIS